MSDMFPPICLPTDPKSALENIRGYIRTLSTSGDRAVKQDGEIVGYWQCTEWLEGLKQIALAIDRIMADNPTPERSENRE